MMHLATRVVCFCDSSDLDSVIVDFRAIMEELVESWPRPLTTRQISIVPSGGEAKIFQDQTIQTVLPVIRECLIGKGLHHLAWEVSDNKDSQIWEIIARLGAVARVSLEVDEILSPPSRALRREQDAAAHRLVDKNARRVAATSKGMYGRPLLIYCYCLTAELVSTGSLSGEQPVKTVFSQLPLLLETTAIRFEEEQPIAVSADRLSKWIAAYEKQIGTSLRDAFRECAP